MPEFIAWYLHNGRLSEGARRLDELVRLRNEEAHGRALSIAEQDERSAALLTGLRVVLGEVSFLAHYRPFRILTSALSRRGGFEGKIQLLTGVAPQEEPVRATWPARLFPEAVYLTNPTGSEVLELSPFLQVIHDPGPREERTFLLASTQKLKKLVLKNDSTGNTESLLISTEEGDVPFDAWFSARPRPDLWQLNEGASEVFQVEGWGVDQTEVLANRFEVQSNLGEGGMATVYLVWDQWEEEQFALKVLHGRLSEDNHFRERFRREARTMKRLRHPNILSVEEVGQLEDGRPYLKLPLLTGGTLADRVKAGASPPDRVEHWAAQMLSGLAYLHEQGIVHRDIKPSNYLLDEHDSCHLADFGIALQTDDSRLTRTLEQMGSMAYMSPEQRRGGKVGAASDLYSLGVVLHELATGREGDADLGRGVAEPIHSLIQALCTEDPEDRLSASEAMRRLITPGGGPTAPPPAPPPPSSADTYHLSHPDGRREVLSLLELVQRMVTTPETVFTVWQLGWSSWRDAREVPEVVASLQLHTPPEPPPPPTSLRRLEPIELQTEQVEPGVFEMAPGLTVTLTRAVAVAPPITRGLWADVLGGPLEGDGQERIDQITWIEAVAFCIALSERGGLQPPYQLTEAKPRKRYSIDDMGRMLREVVPFKKVPSILSRFGTDALSVIQFAPARLAEVASISEAEAEAYGARWDRGKYFVQGVVWDRRASGYRLPTEAEWVHAIQQSDGWCLDWVWCADPGPAYQPVPTPLPEGALTDPCLDEGPRRLARSGALRKVFPIDAREEGLGLRVVRNG
ncbi:MAG TPA: serine/threonine protein kinase [Deltaproteobacteria bacterium]|nr:serine/threonine protein kinase [Deltaproteobacteria bacterium]